MLAYRVKIESVEVRSEVRYWIAKEQAADHGHLVAR